MRERDDGRKGRKNSPKTRKSLATISIKQSYIWFIYDLIRGGDEKHLKEIKRVGVGRVVVSD